MQKWLKLAPYSCWKRPNTKVTSPKGDPDMIKMLAKSLTGLHRESTQIWALEKKEHEVFLRVNLPKLILRARKAATWLAKVR